MPVRVVFFAVEGETDVPVARRIIRYAGLDPKLAIVANGKSKLDPRIREIARSGANMNWLILRDLDHDAPCSSDLVRRLSTGIQMPPRVSLRIAVRAMESWLLADKEGLGERFSLRTRNLAEHPDNLPFPARYLLETLRHSRDPVIRGIIARRVKSEKNSAMAYANMIMDFVDWTWDPERAASRSPSLRRMLARLRELATNGTWS